MVMQYALQLGQIRKSYAPGVSGNPLWIFDNFIDVWLVQFLADTACSQALFFVAMGLDSSGIPP